MTRVVIALVFAFLVAGCVDNSSRRYFVPSTGPFGCRKFASCGSCTPVLGCGWCTIGKGGMCVADPNECAAATSFQWTWEPSGCPAASDGGAPSATDGASDATADTAADTASDTDITADGGMDGPEAIDGDTDADRAEAGGAASD